VWDLHKRRHAVFLRYFWVPVC